MKIPTEIMMIIAAIIAISVVVSVDVAVTWLGDGEVDGEFVGWADAVGLGLELCVDVDCGVVVGIDDGVGVCVFDGVGEEVGSWVFWGVGVGGDEVGV